MTLGENFLLKDQQIVFEPNEWLVSIAKDYPAIEAEYNLIRTNEKATVQEKEAALTGI